MDLSSLVIPLLLAGTALYGLARKVDVYAALSAGAESGLTTLIRILPALVGLLTAVSMLRASGFLEWAASLCAPLLDSLGLQLSSHRW